MERRKFLTGAAVAGAATSLAAPSVAQGKIEMAIVATWPRDFPGLGLPAQRMAARIQELTDGEIQVTYFAAGEKVGAFDSFDEVASGNSQAYIGADYYWKGKHPGWAPFTAIPFGLTAGEMDAWTKYAGGQELWDELAGEFGLKNFAMGNTGVQMGGWFNKEINSADDLQGLKMRIPGLGGTVLSKLGASTVSLPGGQIYENLVSGSIDATEWVGPWNDYFLKFYEATKYYYTGGMHEPGSCIALGMNAEWWGSLTDYEQNVIQAAAAEEHALAHDETMARNGEYLTKLVEEQGVEVRNFNDDVWDAMSEGALEVFEETRDHSALATEVDDAYQKGMREIGGMLAQFETTFLNQRNRVFDIG